MSQDDDFFTQLCIEPREPNQAAGGRLDATRTQRREERVRRRKKRRRRLITVLILVLVLSVAGGVGFMAYWNSGIASLITGPQDYEGAGEGEVVVEIPDGSSGKDIAQILADAGVVKTAGAFANAYAKNANSGNIQPGTYTLRSGMSADNAVAMLLDPASKSDHTMNISEGATKAQVKERLKSVGHYTDAQVEEAFGATDAIGLPEAANGNVEGWLAPGTYDIADDASATDIVASMVSTTIEGLKDLGVAKADYESVLTKASIVEREATPEYYGKVARVIDNRLRDTDGPTRGYLQMDSTVLYGVGRSGGIPTADQIADASNAYNTYAHEGLPPSPIGNPGKETIKSVLNPEAGDWLYFVTVDLDTGETLFATTHEEQEENKKKFDAYCEAHNDTCYGSSSSPGPKPSATPKPPEASAGTDG